MKFDSILIITYGRSGSTLLQGILNSIEGCLIRGENCNFCFGLFESYQNLLKAKTHRGDRPQHPWFGAHLLDETTFLIHARRLVKDLLIADVANAHKVTCYGFKEIRYAYLPEQTLIGYLAFLPQLFPNLALIFNRRNLDDVMKSGWWRDIDQSEARSILRETDRIFEEYACTHANCYQIMYEDVVSQSAKLVGMFEFLGVPYLKDRVARTLGMPFGYDPLQENVKKLVPVAKVTGKL